MKHFKIIACVMILMHFNTKAQTIYPEDFPAWKWVIEPKFDMASVFYEGLAAIKENKKWGFVDRTGNIAIEPQFEAVKQFSDGLAGVRQGKKWGYMNSKGEIVIKHQYYAAYNFKDDIARVERYEGDEDFYINKNGHETPVVPSKNNTDKTQTSRMLFPAVEKGKYGFRDNNNKWVIYPQFAFARVFSDSVACVKVKDKWGYITIATPFESVGMYIQKQIRQGKHTDIGVELIALCDSAMKNFKYSPLYLLDLESVKLGDYDTISNTFLITLPTFGGLVLHTDKEADWLSLKTNWAHAKFSNPIFNIAKNTEIGQPELILESMDILDVANEGKLYKWTSNDRYAHKDHSNAIKHTYISIREAFGKWLLIDDSVNDETQNTSINTDN